MKITNISYESGNINGAKPFVYQGNLYLYIIDNDITFTMNFKNEYEIIDKRYKLTKEQADRVIALAEQYRIIETMTDILNGKAIGMVPPVFEGTDYCSFSLTVNQITFSLKEQKQIAAAIGEFAKALYEITAQFGAPLCDFSKALS